MLSQLDDGSGSGYCGLYLVIRDAKESPAVLRLKVVIVRGSGANCPLERQLYKLRKLMVLMEARMEMGFGGSTISF